MAKKKKTQLKPMARGFATTSVPKKVSPPAEEPSPTFDEEEPKDDTKPASSETGNPVTVGEPDSTQVEQQALQAIVEKLQEKTEKEIIRMVKSIETERRFSKSLPTFELDPRVAQSIVEFVLNGPPSAATPLSGDSSKDLLLQRTGITYGTLRRLGFSEERVLECLRSIQGTEIEEAYEWLALHCSLDELEPDEQKSETPSSTTLSDNSIQSPPTPRTPSQFLIAPSTPSTPTTPPTPSRLDATAPVFHPSGSLRPSKPETQQFLKTGFPEGHTPDSPLPDDGSSGRSSPDTLDPTGRYVELKLRYDALRGKRDPRDLKNAALLESKLAELKSDYLFSQKEANALYEIEREKARSLALKKKLEGKEDVNTQHALLRTMKPDLKPYALPPASESSTEASDDEGLSEGMFAILEPLPETETTSQGKVITINDLALPKHWSGRTPKTLLKDIVHKKDRYATISYALISGHSRAKRVSATIRWQNRLISEWQMEDAACHDEAQAEQYISTVALHALTFPLTEGFAAHPLPQAGQTFFRTFPPAFRDLWDELEAKRKERDEEINRSTWARLLAIVEEKSLADEKVSKKSQKEVQSNQATSRAISTKSSDTSEDVASLYEQRRTGIPYQEMLGHRNLLPIAAYREQILATLQDSQILVLSGETGCGKSTQVPSFILEDQLSRGKHCKIYCTEPRRISAISLAQRVSQELGEPPSALGTANSLIGYSIRLESTTSRNTCLTFVTNGIALRMLEGGSGPGGQGTAFDEITHIIIDEVHERTIESDFLLIVLKSLLRQRPDLRVILMSATVDAEKISDYFDKCPTFHVPGRTFPVNVNYLEDAVELTKWTISETSPFARRLHDKYYQGKARDWSEDAITADDDGESIQENVKLEKRYSPETTATINLLDERLIPYDLIMRLLETICFGQQYSDYSPAILVFMPGLGEIRRLNDILTEHPAFGSSDTFRIYPLHSTLSSENQSAVFEVPPSGIRKIVIATNIAETGITIPDVTCVIDTGKHREMRFDEKRQISRLIETFIAKSNAAQRRGRAGRVREGICFHLFTRLRHDTQMSDSPLPEMMRLSLADLALRIKIMRVNFGASIENVLSQALDPPTSINVQRAIGMLVEVRALTPSEDITPMGRLLSKLPTDVHLGKFLLIATVFRCLDPALTIAAALNSKSPFITPFGQEQEADRAKQAFRIENSDFLTIHNVFASWRQASAANPSFVRKFCRTNYLSHQNLQQIEDLRQQFLGYLVDSNFIQVDRTFVRDLSRARYGRNRARFVWPPQEYNTNGNNASLVHAALAAGLYPKILSVDRTSGQMKTISNNQFAFVHPSSANFGRKVVDFGVNYLSYFTLMHSKRLYAWEIGPVDDAALILLCGECDFKLTTGSVIIDRKVKYKISTKANVALKMLRSHLAELLADHFRSKPLRESQLWWSEGAMKVLGKLDWEPKEQPSIIVS